jgi:hypothetical protein
MREPGADIAALSTQVQALATRRDTLAAAPPEVTYEIVPTGLTFAEYWHKETDLVNQHSRLTASLEAIVISPGHKGRRGLDKSRVDIRWDIEDMGYVWDMPDELIP